MQAMLPDMSPLPPHLPPFRERKKSLSPTTSLPKTDQQNKENKTKV
jgi:hypothetical protein